MSDGKQDTRKKGERYAVYNCRSNDSSVAAGDSEQLHVGRVCSSPAGDCHNHGSGQRYSGPAKGVRSI